MSDYGVYQISDNRIDADDEKISELVADGILNRIETPVYWIDKGALHYAGSLKGYYTNLLKAMIGRGILARLNPPDYSNIPQQEGE